MTKLSDALWARCNEGRSTSVDFDLCEEIRELEKRAERAEKAQDALWTWTRWQAYGIRDAAADGDTIAQAVIETHETAMTGRPPTGPQRPPEDTNWGSLG